MYMGVKLGNIVHGTRLERADLSKKSVAIDASYTIMVFLNRRYGSNPEIPVDKTMRAINHLYGVLYRTISLIECGILPVYCFDGIPDDLKRLSTKNKYNDFERTKERYEQCIKSGNKSQAKTIALGKEFLWMNCIREIRLLLTALGVPHLYSPSEAEAQCAQLVKMGICDYCNTSDFDALLLGSPNIIKIEQIHSRKITGILYQADEIFRQLNLNRFQLVDLGILIGTDFFSGIHGIGLKTGLDLIHNYGNLETIIEKDAKFGPIIKNTIDKEKINAVRKQFLMPVVLQSVPKLEVVYPKRGAILDLLCKDHALEEQKIIKAIDRLERAFDKVIKNSINYSKQTTLF